MSDQLTAEQQADAQAARLLEPYMISNSQSKRRELRQAIAVAIRAAETRGFRAGRDAAERVCRNYQQSYKNSVVKLCADAITALEPPAPGRTQE